MTKKFGFLVTLVVLLLIIQPVFAEEDLNINQDEIIQQQLDKLDLTEIDEMLRKADAELNGVLPTTNGQDLLKMIITHSYKLDFGGLIKNLLKYMFKEVIVNFDLLSKLIILAILCAILKSVQSSFEQGTVSKLAHAICYLVLVGLALSSFWIALNYGRLAIDNMVTFMQALLPLLLSLLVAMGGLISTTIFHPLIILLISTLSTVVSQVVFPLIFFSAILTILSNIAEGFKISKLADLIKDLSVGFLGVMLSVFIGVMVVRGVTSSVSDGVSVRTAKFVTSNFVPIVGKMFSDALEILVSCSSLLKNAIGVLGVIGIILVCAFPVLKIVALIFVYKLASALIQPIADIKIVECLNDMGKSLTLVFAAVASVAIMFFAALTIIVGAGNFTMMIR
ncbi:MAG TPA: stage III sporulation protein AE [Clostridia bacterium]|nr:stage III sporulation protein AE [Clostridia bacterium]